jgi:hypothetical protein
MKIYTKKLLFTCAIALWSVYGQSSLANDAKKVGEQIDSDLSGLFYQPATNEQQAVLWAVQNHAKLHKLVKNDKGFFEKDPNGWNDKENGGKKLHYKDKPDDVNSEPDAEGITKAELSSPDIYIVTERDNKDKKNSSKHNVVLRYDTNEFKTVNEWNLNEDLPKPKHSSNKGLEAIAWIPDNYLQVNGFIMDDGKTKYDPAKYPEHGGGLFFVGLEANGYIYAFALFNTPDQNEKTATIDHKLIATIDTSDSGLDNKIKDLAFDRDNNKLWAYYKGYHVLSINAEGKFKEVETEIKVKIPKGNIEGIAIAPNSECKEGKEGKKAFFLTNDDTNKNDNFIWRGSIPCQY